MAGAKKACRWGICIVGSMLSASNPAFAPHVLCPRIPLFSPLLAPAMPIYTQTKKTVNTENVSGMSIVFSPITCQTL